MNIGHGLITLSDSAPTQLLIPSGHNNLYMSSWTIQNVDNSATVYIGSATVASNDYGFRLAPGASFSAERMPMGAGLYAISTANGSKVAMLRISQ